MQNLIHYTRPIELESEFQKIPPPPIICKLNLSTGLIHHEPFCYWPRHISKSHQRAGDAGTPQKGFLGYLHCMVEGMQTKNAKGKTL